jgi:hypothetical protein
MAVTILRHYQVADLRDVCDHVDDLLVGGPTGSGKTTTIVACTATLFRERKATHIIIAAPMESIERGFSVRDCDEIDIDGRIVLAGPAIIQASRDIGKGSVATINNYLTRPGERMHAIACTHAALCHRQIRLPKSCKGVVLFVDEAHHAPAAKLAGFIKEFRKRGGRLIFFTATPFRHDGLPVALPGMRTRLRSLAEHLQDPLGPFSPREIHSEFMAVEGTFEGEGEPAAADTARLIRAMVKKFEADGRPKAIFKVYGLHFAAKLIKALRAAGVKKVIDATGKDPTPFLQRLDVERDAPYNQTSDCIVGIERVKEGMDWPICSTVYVMGCPGNLGTIIQLLGRSFRLKGPGYPGPFADKARIVFFLPQGDDVNKEQMARDHSRRALQLATFFSNLEAGQQWWTRQAIGFGLGVQREEHLGFDPDEQVLRLLIESELAKAGRPLVGSELYELVSKDPVAKRYEPLKLQELIFDLHAEKLAKTKEGKARLKAAIGRATARVGIVQSDDPALAWGAAYEALLEEFRNETIEHTACADQLHRLTGQDLLAFTERMREALGKPLTKEEIMQQMWAFYEDNRRTPNSRDATASGLGCQWNVLDNNLRRGFRDLPPGCSLAQLAAELATERGIDLRQERTVEEIKEAVRKYIREFSEVPACDSKEPCAAFPGKCWKNVNDWVSRGQRGIVKIPGRTLKTLIDEVLPEPEFADRGLKSKFKAEFSRIPHRQIVEDMVTDFEESGEWATKKCGRVAKTIGVKFRTLGMYIHRGSRVEKIAWSELKAMAQALHAARHGKQAVTVVA